ncbi:TRAP transporter large permease subunit [Candidatus Poribacteria bacterium]|nr:TRAP transporter large permease subunit [Candidatus Poribacteria bacterium]
MSEASIVVAAICAFGSMIVLILGGIYISVALGLIGIVVVYLGMGPSALNILSHVAWNSLDSFVLLAVPLFMLMSEVLIRAGVVESLFKGLLPFLGWSRGKILHVVVLGGAILGALCGSALAISATLTNVAFSYMKRENYDESVSLATIIASGPLGFLIPPSIPFIIYGTITSTSVSKLFMAGIMPGILSAILFMAYNEITVRLKPRIVPAIATDGSRELNFKELMSASATLIPPFILIIIILGSIYGGVATPTEAAGVGCIGAFILAAARRKLNWKLLMDSASSAIQLTATISWILVGAQIFSFAMASMRIPATLAEIATRFSTYPVIIEISIFTIYFILGCFVDSISLIMLTTPITMPIIKVLRIDPLFFGVILVLFCNIGQMTPPFGASLYVASATSKVDLTRIIPGLPPYIILYIVVVALLMLFPEISLFIIR